MVGTDQGIARLLLARQPQSTWWSSGTMTLYQTKYGRLLSPVHSCPLTSTGVYSPMCASTHTGTLYIWKRKTIWSQARRANLVNAYSYKWPLVTPSSGGSSFFLMARLSHKPELPSQVDLPSHLKISVLEEIYFLPDVPPWVIVTSSWPAAWEEKQTYKKTYSQHTEGHPSSKLRVLIIQVFHLFG